MLVKWCLRTDGFWVKGRREWWSLLKLIHTSEKCIRSLIKTHKRGFQSGWMFDSGYLSFILQLRSCAYEVCLLALKCWSLAFYCYVINSYHQLSNLKPYTFISLVSMALGSGNLFSGSFAHNFSGLYQGMSHTVVLLWSWGTLTGPIR